MLITTSRKPSQRTRTFSRSLDRVFNSKYINRGKMSIRDVLIKSSTMGFNKTAVISEMKGNPSRIDIYSHDGDPILSLDITVSISSSRGRIKKDKLHLGWEIEELGKDLKKKIISLLEIPEKKKLSKGLGREEIDDIDSRSNLLLIKKGEKGSKAAVEFYDGEGQKTGPRIFIHNCRI
ncbi:MAG: putative Brix domain-containing ribosomal biogenesis protein [Methanobacterium sp. PtaU1.Bin242]|nr:MAG: putative Brix domain-containing ribosomal biogenesis protein [Methanobacterium sp. PtaU1.Bin242]